LVYPQNSLGLSAVKIFAFLDLKEKLRFAFGHEFGHEITVGSKRVSRLPGIEQSLAGIGAEKRQL